MEGRCHCGAVAWVLDTPPQSVTACNCTICRRHDALWAYGHVGHDIHPRGATTACRRADGGATDFRFCPRCGCLTHYAATRAEEEGRHWTAVTLRMAEPGAIAALAIAHFDGLDSFDDLPRDGRRAPPGQPPGRGGGLCGGLSRDRLAPAGGCHDLRGCRYDEHQGRRAVPAQGRDAHRVRAQASAAATSVRSVVPRMAKKTATPAVMARPARAKAAAAGRVEKASA